MRVVQLASGDLWAGAEVQLYHLAVALSKTADIELKVVLLNHGSLEDKLRSENVDVSVLDETLYGTFTLIKKFYQLCLAFQPDIIHSHRNKEHFIGGLVARQITARSVRTVHGDIEIDRSIKNRLLIALDNWVGNRLQSNIVAVSEELRQKLAQRFHDKKLITINNSLNIQNVESSANEKTASLKNPRAFNIGFVGRLVPVKQIDLLLDIANELNKLTDDVQFHIVGDGPLKNSLKALVIKSGLQDHVSFYGFQENTAPFIKAFDFLLFTSKHEGLPMAMLEAMALKTPVLAIELPTIRSVLNGESGGFFIDSNPKLAARAILNYLDKEKIKARGNSAYQRLKENYDLTVNIHKYLEVYRGEC
jgi:glycosyltransferase involved in cell wall biosynthesis